MILRISNKKIGKAIVFLVSLAIYLKYGGKFIPFVNVLLVALFVIFLSIVRIVKEKKINVSRKILAFLAFVILLLLGVIWSDAPFYGFIKALNVFMTLVAFFVSFSSIREHYKLFLVFNFLFFLLFLISLYVEYGFVTELMGSITRRFRLGWDDSGAFHPIAISRYLGLSILSSLFLLLLWGTKRIFLSIFCILMVLIAFIYMFFSGTKAPILALGLSGLLVLAGSKMINKDVKRIVFLFSFAVFFGVFVAYQQVRSNFDDGMLEFIEYRFFDADSALSDRSHQNQRALSKIKGIEIIIGHGTGDFGYEYTRSDERDYPHNIMSEIIYENGLFPFVLFVFTIFLSVWVVFFSNSIFVVLIASFSNYFFINALFSGDLISNNLALGFAMLLFMSVELKTNKIGKI